MRIEFSIAGTFTVPDGSGFVDGANNLVRLPSGQIISIHPIVEIASGENGDDHRNMTYSEAQDIGIVMEDYDRSSHEVDED